jgi:nucleoside phosphorylase
MLLATDSEGRTVFHVAANLSKPGKFQGILNLPKKNITTEEVNKMLLATDNEGSTVFHVAANLSKPGKFQGILNLAKII